MRPGRGGILGRIGRVGSGRSCLWGKIKPIIQKGLLVEIEFGPF